MDPFTEVGAFLKMTFSSVFPPIFAFVLAPLLLGVINRTKAIFAGRTGQPLLQAYFDLWRLLQKGAVYSRTTTWIFRAGPMIALAAIVVATLVLPFGSCPAPLAFRGDLILLAYLLGLARLFTVLAALDTGSSFEGMGASREVLFSTMAEPALLLGLATIVQITGSLSLSEMHQKLNLTTWAASGLSVLLVAAATGVILLTENSRIPVDDPNTHLELTMIHEVMVLDHSGPDFAFILYGAALKLWVLGSLIVGVVLPIRTGWYVIDDVLALASMLALGIAVGAVESTMARLRLTRVPQLLVGAGTLSAVALVLVYGGA
jgi:formate hydrogenlyase subunit 4